MDQPIRPKANNARKCRIRVVRDESGITRYQLSHDDGVVVESLTLAGAWAWARRVYKSKGITR
jgi:hypothetical protein